LNQETPVFVRHPILTTASHPPSENVSSAFIPGSTHQFRLHKDASDNNYQSRILCTNPGEGDAALCDRFIHLPYISGSINNSFIYHPSESSGRGKKRRTTASVSIFSSPPSTSRGIFFVSSPTPLPLDNTPKGETTMKCIKCGAPKARVSTYPGPMQNNYLCDHCFRNEVYKQQYLQDLQQHVNISELTTQKKEKKQDV